MYPKYIVSLAVIGFLWAFSEGLTPFRRCTDDIQSPESVQIDNCDALPCNVYAGSTTTMTIQFIAVDDNTQNIYAEVVAYVNENAFRHQIPNDNVDVCTNLKNNVQCPLNAGQNVTFDLVLPLDSSSPDVFVEAEVALLDESRKCILCFVTDIQMNALKQQQNV